MTTVSPAPPIVPMFVRSCPLCPPLPGGAAGDWLEPCETCRADLLDRFGRPYSLGFGLTLGGLMIRCQRHRLAAAEGFGMPLHVGPEDAIKFPSGSPEAADVARLGRALGRVDGIVCTAVPPDLSVNYPLLSAHPASVRGAQHDPFRADPDRPFHLIRNTILEFIVRYGEVLGAVRNAHGYDADGVPIESLN